MPINIQKAFDLARRCEKEKPNRLLDAEIAVLLRIRPPGQINAWIDENFPVWRAREDGRVEAIHDNGIVGIHWESDTFTSSIDIAAQLVRGYWRIDHIENYLAHGGQWGVTATNNSVTPRLWAFSVSDTEAAARCAVGLKTFAMDAELNSHD